MKIINATLAQMTVRFRNKAEHHFFPFLGDNNFKRGLYYLPVIPSVFQIIKHYQLWENEEDEKIVKNLEQQLITFENEHQLKDGAIDRIKAVVNKKLRQYQVEDVAKLVRHNFVALFSEPRTGKTPTILEWLRLRQVKKVIIICPKSLQNLVWEQELMKWYPLPLYKPFNEKQKPLSGEKRISYLQDFFNKNTTEGALIISKDTFKLDFKKLKFNSDFYCIIDEAHWLRNNKSKHTSTLQSEAMMHIRPFLKGAAVLTGTPVVNHDSDIFGIFRFLFPQRYENYRDFCDYFWGLDYWGGVHQLFKDQKHHATVTQLQEDFHAMFIPYYIRHLRREVMTWLPDVETKDQWVELTAKQRKEYSEILKQMIALKEDGEKAQEQYLGFFNQLRLISSIGSDGKSEKIAWLVEFAQSIESTEQIIVFSNFSERVLPYVVTALKGSDIGHALITGKTDDNKRKMIIEEFRDKKYQVLLANIQVLKEGVTLDNAAYEIFLDRSLNPADNAQAESRFLPIDKNYHDDKIIINVMAKSSIDAHINALLKTKQNITAYIRENGFSEVTLALKHLWE